MIKLEFQKIGFKTRGLRELFIALVMGGCTMNAHAGKEGDELLARLQPGDGCTVLVKSDGSYIANYIPRYRYGTGWLYCVNEYWQDCMVRFSSPVALSEWLVKLGIGAEACSFYCNGRDNGFEFIRGFNRPIVGILNTKSIAESQYERSVTYIDLENDLIVSSALYLFGLYDGEYGSDYYRDKNLSKKFQSVLAVSVE